REDMQRAGEAAREGEVSQALAAGTRAQRQLQTLRDEIRQESASEFAEDLRNMRAEARQLEREQESILGELASENAGQRRTLGSPERPEGLVERLEEQQRRLTNLV